MRTATTTHSKGITWSLSHPTNPVDTIAQNEQETLDLIRDKLNSFTEQNRPTGETLPPTPPPTLMPSSILDIMVARYIQNGIDMRPAPTASQSPSNSPRPTSTGSPTAPRIPTSSPHNKSFSPTVTKSLPATISPSLSPVVSDFSTEPSHFPTDTFTHTHIPTEVRTDPPESLQPQGLVTQDKIPTSVGYGHRCTNLEMAPNAVQEEVVFTYLTESTVLSPTFLTELEVHLLDHAASEALQCTADTSIYIYEIKYPENRAASEVVTCQPSHFESKSCWILRTTMLVTTDNFSTRAARHIVLSDLKEELNGGILLTKGFEDISFSQYVGPNLITTLTPQVTRGDHVVESQSFPFLRYALIAASASAFCISLFLGCYILKRRRQAKNSGNELTSTEGVSDNYDSDGSVEIAELLSKTRKRIQRYKDDPSQESWDNESSPLEENSTYSSEYQHSQSTGESNGGARKTDAVRLNSAENQYYLKSRKAPPSDSPPRNGNKSSKNKRERQRQSEDIERCDLSRKNTKSSKSSRRNKK